MQEHLASGRSHSSSGPTPTVFPYEQVAGTTPWPDVPGAEPCPACGALAVNVQGLLDCPNCD